MQRLCSRAATPRQRATSLAFGVELRSAVLLYLSANAVRLVVMLALLPLLRRLGYGTSLREALLLAFSGMRGAVAIALSLMANDEKEVDQETRAIWGFHAAGTSLRRCPVSRAAPHVSRLSHGGHVVAD